MFLESKRVTIEKYFIQVYEVIFAKSLEQTV